MDEINEWDELDKLDERVELDEMVELSNLYVGYFLSRNIVSYWRLPHKYNKLILTKKSYQWKFCHELNSELSKKFISANRFSRRLTGDILAEFLKIKAHCHFQRTRKDVPLDGDNCVSSLKMRANCHFQEPARMSPSIGTTVRAL